MDEATKTQCGLAPEEPATEETVPECTGNSSLVPESPLGPYCDYSGGAEGGTSGIPEGTPPLPEEFSGYSCDLSSPPAFENPAAPNEITNRACGYTDEYGTEHNADPWIEDQLRSGCEQGYITEGC